MKNNNPKQIIWEKAKLELHLDAACCFEPILKTVAVWPFTSHLTNHPTKIRQKVIFQVQKRNHLCFSIQKKKKEKIISDVHAYNYLTVCKLFVLRIVTWSSNCLLRIIIIISYLKPFNCVQIICIKNSYLKL